MGCRGDGAGGGGEQYVGNTKKNVRNIEKSRVANFNFFFFFFFFFLLFQPLIFLK